MRMWNKKKNAVSPVIAVILMVAITVVLAAVLYVTVQNIANQNTGDVSAMGVNVDKVNRTTYRVTVASGQALVDDTTIKVLTAAGTNATVGITYNNLNGNTYVDAGDTISIDGYTANLKGYTLQIAVGASIAVSQEFTS